MKRANTTPNHHLILIIWCFLFLLSSLSGCSRKPLQNCPDIPEFGLSVTEVKAEQILLNNPTSDILDISGLRIKVTKLDGSSEKIIIVRQTGLYINPGETLKLGNVSRSNTDYAYGWYDDFVDTVSNDVENGTPIGQKLHKSGVISLYACGVKVYDVGYIDEEILAGD